MYTFLEDYFEDLADGSGRKLLFERGQQISWATAYALGLVATPERPGARGRPKKAAS